MPIFRPINESELMAAHEVYYQNELREQPDVPLVRITGIPRALSHIFQTGTVYVAEEDGHILGFAGAITRGNVSFLTDLFVLPTNQSHRLGNTLLFHTQPRNELIRCTMSSTDPRALALYIRAGMQPWWPNFNLQLNGQLRKVSTTAAIGVDHVDIVEGIPGDPELVAWDAHIGGRPRPVDHAYWIQKEQAVPLWFERNGQRIGYGYVRQGVGSLSYPQACIIGPIGVRATTDATACVLAAVQWAAQQAEVLRIDVPGPHPCLALLLESGFQIIYVETFLSTANTPFFDAQCYISSGSNFF